MGVRGVWTSPTFGDIFFQCFVQGTGGYASTYLDTGLGLANYIKLRLTGGLSLDDCAMHEKIQKIETDSCIDSERFRRDHHYLMFLLLIGRSHIILSIEHKYLSCSG